MEKFGIDISAWQGDFDFYKAKNEGVQFCIIKAGGSDAGRYIDKRYSANIIKTDSIHIPRGAYYFGKDMTIEDAKQSAIHFASIVAGNDFDLPLFYDVEGQMLNLDKRTLTDIVKAFCNQLESLTGKKCGIYASLNTFKAHLYDEELSKYYHWVACWGKSKPSSVPCDIWQFGGETNFIRTNKVAGVTCDQNYCYMDFETSEPVKEEPNKNEINDALNDIIKACEKLKGIINGN